MKEEIIYLQSLIESKEVTLVELDLMANKRTGETRERLKSEYNTILEELAYLIRIIQFIKKENS